MKTAQLKGDLAESALIRLPLGYQKIYQRALMPKHIEEKILVQNTTFRARAIPTASAKPISKIVL